MCGFVFITIGVLSGAICAILLSRHLFSKTIKKRYLTHHRSFMVIDKVISNEGWRTIFLLRMTPLPFAICSYLLGVTSVKMKDYILGSLSVMFHIAIWLYIGQSLTEFSEI